MAEAVPIRFYYGTRSGFDSVSDASEIGQPYFLTDLNAIVVAHSTDAPSSGNLNFLRGAVKTQSTGSTPTDSAADAFGAASGLLIFDTSSDTLYISNGSTWETISTGAQQLSDLTDVGVATPTDGNVLRGDGDSWESAVLQHDDLGGVGADDHHNRDHAIDSTSDHDGVSGATEDNFVSFDSNGLPKDSGKSDSDYEDAGAVTSHESTYDHSDLHTRQHAIDSASDHTGTATTGNLLEADANGLPTDASYKLNDSGDTSADLWSASKIDSEIQSAIDGLDWQDSVLSYITDNTVAPPSETTGNRFILAGDGGAPHANWDGASAGDLVEFNGSTWDAYTPNEGWAAWVEDTNETRVYNGSAWVKRAATENHNDMANIQGGTASERYHLTNAQHTVATQAATSGQNGYMTSTYASKLDGIEDSADVTDATNVAAAGAIMGTSFSGKGELIGASADDTPGILAAGTDNYVLIADSGETLGIKWGPVAGGTF